MSSFQTGKQNNATGSSTPDSIALSPQPEMTAFRRFWPRTLLVRTFLLISALLFVSVVTWLTLFGLAEREPRARELAQLAVSVVNLTNAALIAADPVRRVDLLKDLADSEGVHLYPLDPDDVVVDLPDTYFYRLVNASAQAQLGPGTRFAQAVNGRNGIWVSFSLDNSGVDDYWLRLPSEHADSDFPWEWLGWGGVSLTMALLVAWLIVSRVTLPLRELARAALEVGDGRHPSPVLERGALELRQLAEAFNRMSANLQRINAERAEILAGISHDLRTPLARLRLETEMSIADEGARNGAAEDIEQMDAIIGQFLDFARGDRDAGSPQREKDEATDVNTLIEQIARSMKRGAVVPKLVLGDLPIARVQPQALTRAVINLLENARKYGRQETETEGEIEIVTDSKAGELHIDVMDRGPGIPESEVERIKRPFTRLEGARTDAAGTGLGLAIVERIAGAHGGRLELLPRPGGGLLARLVLPIRH